MKDIPLWVRRAFVDAVETAVATVATLSLVIPNSLTEAKAQALILGVAFGAACISAFRRAILAGGLEWFRSKMLGD